MTATVLAPVVLPEMMASRDVVLRLSRGDVTDVIVALTSHAEALVKGVEGRPLRYFRGSAASDHSAEYLFRRCWEYLDLLDQVRATAEG